MSEPDPTTELEATIAVNGSGPRGDTGGEAAIEKKGEEENGVRKVEGEEGKEDKKDDDVKMVEAEDVKGKEDKEGRGGGDGEEEEETKIEEENELSEGGGGDEEEGTKFEEENELGEGGGEEEGGTKIEEENELKEKEDNRDNDKKVEENKEAKGGKKKRTRRRKAEEKGKEEEKDEGATEAKELSTPVASSVERPVRERRTVERLVEVLEKEPAKGVVIEKGRGTPLKDIPNVAYKLAKKKPADVRLLHQILFGRKGKALNFKNHISQFSGFVWHENEEKQRAKMKEKLDKCVKGPLLDLCDLFDIPVLKATTRKEDLVVKLLDFMVAPHATTDVVLADKEQQSTKSRKRKRVAKGSDSKSSGGMPMKRSRKKRIKSEETPKSKGKSEQETEDEGEDEDEEEEEDNENGIPDEDEAVKDSESEEAENVSVEDAEEEKDEDDDEDSGKGKRDRKKRSKRGSSAGTEKSKKLTSPKKSTLPTSTKSPSKTSSSKRSKAEDSTDVGPKVFSRKKKNVDPPKKKSTPKPVPKEKSTGKKVARGKTKSGEESGPSKEELRKAICEILKEVDFNTATFTDILKQLATQYKTDLTPRKGAIKIMIQEELTKLADEAEEDEDEEDEGDAEKDENLEPTGKEVEA